jgi:hypothetical protein
LPYVTQTHFSQSIKAPEIIYYPMLYLGREVEFGKLNYELPLHEVKANRKGGFCQGLI